MVIIILSYLELVKSVQSVRHDVIHYGNQGRSSRSDFMLKRRVSKVCQTVCFHFIVFESQRKAYNTTDIIVCYLLDSVTNFSNDESI